MHLKCYKFTVQFTSQCVALCQWTRTYIFCWCWCWAPAQCDLQTVFAHLCPCCTCNAAPANLMFAAHWWRKIEDQCNALLEPDLERVFGQNLVNKRQLTTPSLSSGFSRENIVPSVARPFTWIRPWGSTMTLCTLNSSAHCTLRKHNSTLHTTGDGAQVLLSFGQSGSRRLCHSGSISS